MRRLHKLLTLAPADLGFLVTASLLLAQARWKLTRRPIANLINEIRTPFNTINPVDMQRAARIAWALQTAAGVVPWRSDCLIRAIAARDWAEQSGLPYEFHLGVSVGTAGKLEAHAWSQSGSTFLSGDISGLDRFREFNLEQLSSSELHFSR